MCHHGYTLIIQGLIKSSHVTGRRTPAAIFDFSPLNLTILNDTVLSSNIDPLISLLPYFEFGHERFMNMIIAFIVVTLLVILPIAYCCCTRCCIRDPVVEPIMGAKAFRISTQ